MTEKQTVTPTVGGTYFSFGLRESPFKIIKEENKEENKFLIKNLSSGYETHAYGVECYSDGSIEWERSAKGYFT